MQKLELELDHIAVGCADLAEGAAWVSGLLGVALQPGGRHLRYGTHNLLLALGDIYLEIIAIDPSAPRGGPAWFGLDHFTGPPRLVNWICRCPDPAAAPAKAGPVRALERGDLAWQITVPDDGGLPDGGAFPTLIRWAPGTRHPVARLPDSAVRLTAWEVHHPDAAAIGRGLRIDDPRVVFVSGPARFRATFDTPDGARVLT